MPAADTCHLFHRGTTAGAGGQVLGQANGNWIRHRCIEIRRGQPSRLFASHLHRRLLRHFIWHEAVGQSREVLHREMHPHEIIVRRGW